MKRFVNQLLAPLPRLLPVGMSQMNIFVDRVLDLAGPYADKDSMTFALVSIIIHADATKGRYSDNYFLARLRKSAANQVASQVFQDIKIRQQEAAAKQQAEATALTQDVANEEQKTV